MASPVMGVRGSMFNITGGYDSGGYGQLGLLHPSELASPGSSAAPGFTTPIVGLRNVPWRS